MTVLVHHSDQATIKQKFFLLLPFQQVETFEMFWDRGYSNGDKATAVVKPVSVSGIIFLLKTCLIPSCKGFWTVLISKSVSQMSMRVKIDTSKAANVGS